MAKKIKTEATTNKTKKIAYIIAAILVGIIIIGSIFGPSTKEAESNDSIQTGQWSAGYRYYFDMDEDEKSKLRLFGKYKQAEYLIAIAVIGVIAYGGWYYSQDDTPNLPMPTPPTESQAE